MPDMQKGWESYIVDDDLRTIPIPRGRDGLDGRGSDSPASPMVRTGCYGSGLELAKEVVPIADDLLFTLEGLKGVS